MSWTRDKSSTWVTCFVHYGGGSSKDVVAKSGWVIWSLYFGGKCIEGADRHLFTHVTEQSIINVHIIFTTQSVVDGQVVLSTLD